MDVLDGLFSEWAHWGAPVLLKASAPVRERTIEELIAESSFHSRENSRLAWITLWGLRHFASSLNLDLLLAATRQIGDEGVLGALAEAARTAAPHTTFDAICKTCRRPASLEVFFHRVAKSRTATAMAQSEPVEALRRWNYLSAEVDYL